MLHFRKEDTRTPTSSRGGIPADEKLKTRKPSFEGAKKMGEINRNPNVVAGKEQEVGCSGNSRPKSLFWRELGLRTAEKAK